VTIVELKIATTFRDEVGMKQQTEHLELVRQSGLFRQTNQRTRLLTVEPEELRQPISDFTQAFQRHIAISGSACNCKPARHQSAMASLKTVSAAQLLRNTTRNAPILPASRRLQSSLTPTTSAPPALPSSEARNPHSPDYGAHVDKATSYGSPVRYAYWQHPC